MSGLCNGHIMKSGTLFRFVPILFVFTFFTNILKKVMNQSLLHAAMCKIASHIRLSCQFRKRTLINSYAYANISWANKEEKGSLTPMSYRS